MRFRHWVGVDEFEGRLSTLLKEHAFGSVRDWMAKSAQESEPVVAPGFGRRAAV